MPVGYKTLNFLHPLAFGITMDHVDLVKRKSDLICSISDNFPISPHHSVIFHFSPHSLLLFKLFLVKFLCSQNIQPLTTLLDKKKCSSK